MNYAKMNCSCQSGNTEPRLGEELKNACACGRRPWTSGCAARRRPWNTRETACEETVVRNACNFETRARTIPSCGCGSEPAAIKPCGCGAVRERSMDTCGCTSRENHWGGECPVGCGGDDCLSERSLAMVYSPNQDFTALYDPRQGLCKGTVFCKLDKPFYGGGNK